MKMDKGNIIMKKIGKRLMLLLAALFSAAPSLFIVDYSLSSKVVAQDVTVTVTPVQQVLPPQIMLYVSEPGNYFNVSLSNTGKDNANVYLVMQIEQTNPSTGLGLSTPPRRQPQMPIVVPAGGTRILTPAEIRGLFNHIPMNEIKAPADLFSNYADGSFGLLPEGTYEIHLTAYHWDPASEPYVVSSPTGGTTFFQVCYNAQAPEFLTPMAPGATALDLFSVAELDALSPMLTWKAPLITCNPTLIQYEYSIRIVEVLPGQNPDNSMDSNPVVFQQSSLTTPQCMVPFSVIQTMSPEKVYAAQVTATPSNSNNRMLNYVSIENKGKSTYKLFRLKGVEKPEVDTTPKAPEPEDDGIEEDKDKDSEGDKNKSEETDEDEDDDDIMVNMGDVKTNEIVEDSLYTFRNPKIVDPYFLDTSGVRKRFVESGIEVAWERPRYVGGEGQQNDTIKIEYEVQLFDNGERADREDAVQQEPIYTFHTTEQKDTIQWEDIAEKVEAGDYMLLRIKPIVSHGNSVGFTGDDNVVDFAMVNRLSQQYFQCSSTTEIENKKPTTKAASDLKGKEVSIGEYLMTIDQISGNGTDGFSGKGRVKWEPFGHKVMVCVKFDKLKINIDDVVYEGIAESYAGPQIGSMEAVDNLFSEWGLDNLIGDSGIPYANMLQNKATGAVKSLAEQIDLGNYYKAYQDGKNLYKFVTSEDLNEVYMPIGFPMEVLPSGWDVVDIQIAGMKFAANYATMNIIGQAKLPECDVLKSKLLVFGAPRVCISPNRFLPESGHIALLGDFTLAPNSNFELTFKAPHDVLEPKDGCYISWHADTLELLGIDADMKVAGIVKDVNGKATTERPVINLKASFGSWSDFLVDNISIDDFQVEDLPGWTFTAKNLVYDHSIRRNSQHMGAFPERFSKTKAGIKGNDESWQGLHIGEIGIKFPTSLQIGDTGDGDQRLSIKGEEMFFDNNITLKMSAENIFSAKSGTMGGWGISLDKAQLQIIQDDFDNCMFAGQLNIPLFGSKEKKKDKNGKEKFGNVDYTCEIRRLTDPRPRSALSEQVNATNLQKTRYSYVFLTEQVEDLNFDCFVAQVDLDHKQTYFLIEAFDDEKSDKINTQVELCLGGTIGIGGVDDANEWLKNKTASLPLELKIPDIHFTKMRLSNVKRAEWVSISKLAEDKRKAREAREIEVEKELKKNKLYYKIAESEEMALGESFYLDLGEWSLASARKRLGPFSFNLDKFKPSYKNNKLQLEIGGTIGLVEDKINVGAAVIISAELQTPGTDISKWSISEGDVKFDSLGLDLDFTALHLKGSLKVIEDGKNKGYKGDLDIAITGLFDLKCEGGYFEHDADAASLSGMREDGVDTQNLDAGDRKYSWGYFMVKVESSTGIRVDPIVINRISGGFYFNCRPTKGEGEGNKFTGDPEPAYGNIGVALGMKLSTSAGESTLSANMDLLVCYDKKNKCLSTFMFNGDLKAVGGIIKAEASLIYENQKTQAGTTQNRYLCLNVTVEAGADTKSMIESVTKANASLAQLKGTMDKFQANVGDVANKMVINPSQGLKQLSGDYNKDNTDDESTEEEASDIKNMDAEEREELGITAMKTKISLEFKITWVKNGTTYSTPRWHLYLGEPEKDKRCSYTFLKFSGKIVTVDIGADAYLCLGNELPNNGALPAIPSKITEFLSGHKSSSTDMGGDLGKAERSRKRAAEALLGDDINGGVMVGASAWGYLSLNLGLLYGEIDAMAGFDCSLVNYGNSAFCVNSGKVMGKNGWYAMGQFYAYLYAALGIHVKIGHFINEKIKIFSAGIGGVLELGLPNPTWVEGQARIKISLLGGLCKINKKFEFSAGDHCVPFKGNALDGFEMFQEVSHGSDSLYQALIDPTFAVSLNEARNMTFTTTSSIGSHYRLLDPSWTEEMMDRAETSEEDLNEKIAQNASRTYVFDMDQNLDLNNMKMGVHLFDLGTGPTELVASGEKVTEADLFKKLADTDRPLTWSYRDPAQMVSRLFRDRESTVSETSWIRKGRSLNNGLKTLLHGDKPQNRIEGFLSDNKIMSTYLGISVTNRNEVNASFREDKGTTFHLSNMELLPGHSYALFLSADAYEIENGQRVWCYYVDDAKKDDCYIQWRQTKAWFFRVKSDEEERIITDSLRNLEPYIALAYPSTNGTRVVDTRGEGTITAYYDDIMSPTIALNRNISKSLPAEKMKWVLTGITAAGDTLEPQIKEAKYVTGNGCINLQPVSRFNGYYDFTSARNNAVSAGKTYDYNNELYHLELRYTYSYQKRVTGRNKHGEFTSYVATLDSTFNLVDLMLTTLPHDMKIGNDTYTDSWQVTTSKDINEPLPYSYPFVGARIYAQPTIDYEKDYTNGKFWTPDGSYLDYEILTDEDHVFKNTKYSKYNLPYRVIDPYLYFAYLAKWVFVGDREISPYGFDEIGCKFASESLIFNYNGTTVNTEFLKDVKNKSIYQVRNQMYNVWNDWYYNNHNMPCYPLPSTSKSVGGITANNQDGKASTVTPLNVNHYKDYTYCFQDLVKDYTAVYNVADKLCQGLKQKSEELVGRFFVNYWQEMLDSKYKFDDNFNNGVRNFQRFYRGTYLEYSDRGYNVKVPYYQLPLIYGDCFGGSAKYNNWSPGKADRTFSKSIGEGDFKSGDADNVNLRRRYWSESSNLLFFRLGTAGQSNYSWSGQRANGTIDYYTGSIYLRWKNENNDSYVGGTGTSMNVQWDEFRKDKALEAVSDFSVYMYRVNAYSIASGQYVYESGRGGGPAPKYFSINAENETATNMGEMTAAITQQEEHLRTHYDQPQLQAFFLLENKELVFLYSDSVYIKSKGYNGWKIEEMWIGEEAFENKEWQRVKNYCKAIQFDSSMQNADIRSTKGWFWGFKSVTSIYGLNFLNTSNVTNMSGMFHGCEGLTSFNMLKGWNTSKVTDMSSMFSNCYALKKLDLRQWDTGKVTNMHDMFSGCTSLEELEQNFNTSKVTSMNCMFYGCESLDWAPFDNFTSESLTDIGSMFYGCSKLEQIDLDGLEGMKLTKTTAMFANCGKLSHLHLKGLACKDDNFTWKSSYEEMFKGVSPLQYCDINYGLIDKIKDQIPGDVYPVYDDNYKAIYGTITSQNREVLIFMRSTIDYKKNQNYSFALNGVARTVKVLDFWTGKTILSPKTGQNKLPWTAYRENIKDVYVLSSFAQSPDNTQYWFYGFTNLEHIYGLTNLNTSRVESMKGMFQQCGKLTELDLSKFSTAKLTDMSSMFSGCESIEGLSFGYNWKTENVTSMGGLFNGCKSLKHLSLVYDFDTKNVTGMTSMFAGCEQLENINMSFGQVLNTENVTNMGYMFKNCKSLKWMPSISSTKNVSNMYSMFYNCESLEGVNFTGFDLSKVTSTSYMFYNCKSIKEVNLSTFMGEKVSSVSGMFMDMNRNCYIYIPYDCNQDVLSQCPQFPNLVLIYPAYCIKYKVGGNSQLLFLGSKTELKAGDKYNGYTIDNVWSGSTVMDSRTTYDAPWTSDLSAPVTKVVIDPSFKNVPIVNAYGYFSFMSKKCTSITGLQYLNMANAKLLAWMFSSYQGESLDLSQWNTQSATNMSYMFNGCSNLKTLSLGSNFKTDNVTTMNAMFSGCRNLTSVNLTSFNTSNVQEMNMMFNGCRSLTSLNLHNFNVSNVKDGYMFSLFENCRSMRSVDISGFDLSKQTSMLSWFSNCQSLESLDLSSVDLSNMKEVPMLLDSCVSLRKLVIGDLFSPSNIRKSDFFGVTGSFKAVHDLTVITPEAKMESIRDAFIEKLGFVEGVTGTFYNKEPEKVGQALWINDNKTLVFFYGTPVGDYYDGQVVTKKWQGEDVLGNRGSYAPWTDEIASSVQTVKYDVSFANARPTSTKSWFLNMRKLTEIQNMKYLNTSEVTDMSDMFNGTAALKDIDLSNFNTSKVTSMSYMFYYTGAEELNVSTFNTSKVTNMSRMFCQSDKLKALDLSTFNTTNVTSAPSLFNGCRALKELKLGQNCTFSKIWPKKSLVFTGVSGMEVLVHSAYLDAVEKSFTDDLGFTSSNGVFIPSDKRKAQAIWSTSDRTLRFVYTKDLSQTSYYKGVYISKVWSEDEVKGGSQSNTSPWASYLLSQVTTVEFDPSFANVTLTKMYNWFKGCTSLTTVKGLEYLKTDAVTTMYGLFMNCAQLNSIDLSNFNTKSLTSISHMFDGCSKLTSLDLSNFNTSNLKFMEGTFRNCSKLTELNLNGFETGRVVNMKSLFEGCSKLSSVDIASWNTINVTDMSRMFYNCSAMKEIKTTNFNTSNVTDMSRMFAGCSSLTYPYVYSFDVSKVRDFSYMFYGCSAATGINLSQWTTPSATTMEGMFYNCSSASIIETSKFNTQKVTNMAYMFYNTRKLQSSWLSSFDTSNVTNMSYMFAYCGSEYSHKWISVSNFNTAKVTKMDYMFTGCCTLTNLDLNNFNMLKVTSATGMFNKCTALQTMSIGSQFKPNLSSSTSAFLNVSGLKVTIKNVSSGSSDKYTIANKLKLMGFTNNSTGTVSCGGNKVDF